MADVKKKPIRKSRSEPVKKVAKKKPSAARKAATKQSATQTAAPAKKAPAKKTASAVKPARTRDYTPHPKQFTPEGFLVGSDSAIIASVVVDGGVDRNDVNEKAKKLVYKTNGSKTRNGGDKYVPSMVSAVVNRMIETGYYDVEASWKLVKRDRKRPARKKK